MEIIKAAVIDDSGSLVCDVWINPLRIEYFWDYTVLKVGQEKIVTQVFLAHDRLVIDIDPHEFEMLLNHSAVSVDKDKERQNAN